jgi:hypothetical protein
MGRSRVVLPESVRIPLSHEDWIVLKKRLTAGESRAQFARIIKYAPGGERPTLDSIQVGLSRILAYLLDWSLVGPDDTTVLPLRNGKGELSVEVMTSSLNSIDPDSFGEILKAVEAHEEAMDAERAVEKNGKGGSTSEASTTPVGENSSSAISTSVV